MCVIESTLMALPGHKIAWNTIIEVMNMQIVSGVRNDLANQCIKSFNGYSVKEVAFGVFQVTFSNI